MSDIDVGVLAESLIKDWIKNRQELTLHDAVLGGKIQGVKELIALISKQVTEYEQGNKIERSQSESLSAAESQL